MENLNALRTRLGGLWLHTDFLKLWAGQTISELGSHVTRDGLPLVGVITLGATPIQMGILSALGSAPVLLFGLFAGVWVDRLRRRPIMIAIDIARGLLMLTVPLAAVLGLLRIEYLYVLTALAGVLTLFFSVAYRAYLPTLVEREHIVEGNSKLAFTDSATEIAGPELTGVLVQAVTAPIAMLIDALSYFVSALSLASIRKPEPPPAAVETRQSVRSELNEGVRAVFQHPVLRALAAGEGILSFFGNFIGTLYGLYSIRILGMGPAALGLTIAMGGVGSLVGALLARRVVMRIGLGPTMIGTMFLMTFTHLMIPLAGGAVLTAVLVLAAAQLFGDSFRTIYFINSISLRQAITPDRLMGRVNASIELLAAGIGPLGALVGGALGQTIGVRPTLVIAASGSLIAALILFFSAVRKLDQHPGETGGET